VHGGVAAAKKIKDVIRRPRRVVRVAGHVIRILASGVLSGKKFIVIVVVRPSGCPRDHGPKRALSR
jgi:hypothetical protein